MNFPDPPFGDPCYFCEKSSISLVHEREMFKCDIGSKEFPKKRLIDHISSVHDEKKPFNCNFCPSYFAFLTMHMKSVHEGKNPFSCNICTKSFSKNDHLNQHICQGSFYHTIPASDLHKT